jgi:hypothetical protein
VNIFPKAYFIDFTTQKTQDIAYNIQKMHHRDCIVIRQNTNKNAIDKVTKLAKHKHITVFSYFQNGGIKHNIHLASSRKKSVSHGEISISFHTTYDFNRLQIFKPSIAFLSPVFKTQTHPNAKPLGKIQTFKIALQIRQISPQTRVFLLGGMTQKRFASLKKLDFTNVFTGYAGIRGIF